MTQLTDERVVREKWPRAICWTHGIFRDMLAIYDPPCNKKMEPFWGKMLSDTFHEKEADAWHDAAERIRKERP